MSTDAGAPLTGLLLDVAKGMPITADISRSDVLLVCPAAAGRVKVIAQAHPHSISPLYSEDLTGCTFGPAEAPTVFEAWRRRRPVQVQRDVPGGAAVLQDARPILDNDRRVLGLLSIETSMIQIERHRQRHPSFQRAVEWLKVMCVRGALTTTTGLSPFGESDGILLADFQRRITYVSGIASNLYRRLGYREDLRRKRLSYLHTCEDEMAVTSMLQRSPLEREDETGGYTYVRKALPIWSPLTLRAKVELWPQRAVRSDEAAGVLILVHDATEERRKRQELETKATMIQEVHHRVKNNLQTIAAVLRMQTRRAQEPATQQALREAINRILSVAVIHEFLSLDENQTINVREVCQRIVAQSRDGMLPGQRVSFSVDGPTISLPSQQATACALVVNELIQNALEHGFEERGGGEIRVRLTDSGDRVEIEIWDDGKPLPTDFSLEVPASLGLQIVRSLVQGDLRGQLTVENRGQGVAATVGFPKAVPAGKSAAATQ